MKHKSHNIIILTFAIFFGCQHWVTYAFSQETSTLIAIGDIMLSRGVGNRINKFGAKFPFEPMADLLSH